MISSTMGTTHHGLGGKQQGPTMRRPTRPKDPGQVAHNRGSLEDTYRTNSYKYGK
jgi:hypothetical protein